MEMFIVIQSSVFNAMLRAHAVMQRGCASKS
jgi:hypothetical protein